MWKEIKWAKKSTAKELKKQAMLKITLKCAIDSLPYNYTIIISDIKKCLPSYLNVGIVLCYGLHSREPQHW